MSIKTGFTSPLRNRPVGGANGQLKSADGESSGPSERFVPSKSLSAEAPPQGSSPWQSQNDQRNTSFRFPNEIPAPQRTGELHWVLGGDRTSRETKEADLKLWEQGQAGALLGGDSAQGKPASYEDHGGAFLRP